MSAVWEQMQQQHAAFHDLIFVVNVVIAVPMSIMYSIGIYEADRAKADAAESVKTAEQTVVAKVNANLRPHGLMVSTSHASLPVVPIPPGPHKS